MIQWILRLQNVYHLVRGPLVVAHTKAQVKFLEVFWAIFFHSGILLQGP